MISAAKGRKISKNYFGSARRTPRKREFPASAPNTRDIPSVKAARNPSTASGRTRFTVDPPNPPPVIRAPNTPVHPQRRLHQEIQLRAAHFVIVPQAVMRFRHDSPHFRRAIAPRTPPPRIAPPAHSPSRYAGRVSTAPRPARPRSLDLASRRLDTASLRAASAHSSTLVRYADAPVHASPSNWPRRSRHPPGASPRARQATGNRATLPRPPARRPK